MKGPDTEVRGDVEGYESVRTLETKAWAGDAHIRPFGVVAHRLYFYVDMQVDKAGCL